ncbi:MAG: TetR/AcrR family transcriptional regulator, partial [Actinomycetes bacterium]
MTEVSPRGRPPIRTDAQILQAALKAFATSGYEAMSVRALNASLGLSHETISQRFGSKQDLFFAALDHGLADFFAGLAPYGARSSDDSDDLGQLRQVVRGFMLVAAEQSELGQVINREGLVASDRLDYIVRRAIEPGTLVLADLLRRLTERGEIRPSSVREVFFLAQAGATPFNAPALSQAFDRIDGPLDPDAYAER